jgi:hypothetical protein
LELLDSIFASLSNSDERWELEEVKDFHHELRGELRKKELRPWCFV